MLGVSVLAINVCTQHLDDLLDIPEQQGYSLHDAIKWHYLAFR